MATKTSKNSNAMEHDNFYPFMKVSLNGEFGVVTDQFWEGDDTYTVKREAHNGTPYKCYGLIRWDTNKGQDYEDWRGLWGTFVALGGQEIDLEYKFKFINDDGTFIENQKH